MIAEGVLLNGRYRIGRVLAVGGMGQVWRGSDEQLNTHVAIKVLKDEATTNAVFLKRFEIEARNAAGLGHRNIAQVLDYGTFEGNAFMIMELVEGESLAAILERERVLDARRLVRILIDSCHGLQAAHDAGVIHRDIKPGNLLVQPDGVVKITDFGVSRSADQTSLTQTGMVMGTAQYLAPELALGKPATARSDLYALGIIAYEALVGKRPFTAPNPVDIAIAQVNDPVPPLPDTIPPALAAVIMDLLEKNPKRRPDSARSLAHTLSNVHLPTEAEQRFRTRSIPESIRPRHRGGAPSRPMPPSIAPRNARPRPDTPAGG
jgi:serine/threonine-protein kinase